MLFVFSYAQLSIFIPYPNAKIFSSSVSGNDFFLRATGLTVDEAKSLTIFSIVRADKLSMLFELVANALRTDAEKGSSLQPKLRKGVGESILSSDIAAPVKSFTGKNRSTEFSTLSGLQEQDNNMEVKLRSHDCDFSAVTLPCILFPSNYPEDCAVHHAKKRLKEHHSRGEDVRETNHNNRRQSDLPIQLYMTVTLMTDDDPRKRCFHCVFTDSPATQDHIGSVTTELLAMLFTEQSSGA